MAVFHDRFGAFREEILELLQKKQVREWRALCYLNNVFLLAVYHVPNAVLCHCCTGF